MTVGVIISTYNKPDFLKCTLDGYCRQTRLPNEVIIADDGSTEETCALINAYREKLPIKHVWHEDNGFKKTTILNKAILASESEYLIFTDQDCIPREDFVEMHEKNAQQGYFLSGGYLKLTEKVSQRILDDNTITSSMFSISFLISSGQRCSFKLTKLFRYKWYARLLNTITPTKATWNGCNSSGWRKDMIAINGFNEDMRYGGEDREFGERLWNLGIKSKQIRYSAIVIHLYHDRPYKTLEAIKKNDIIRKYTRIHKIVKTRNGIRKLDKEVSP